MTDIPHLALPFTWTRGLGGTLTAAVTEQESTDELADCAAAIIRTVQGQRSTLPDFGRPQLEFASSVELTNAALAGALLEWEPRLSALVTGELDPDDPELQRIRALLSPADDQEAAP